MGVCATSCLAIVTTGYIHFRFCIFSPTVNAVEQSCLSNNIVGGTVE